MAKSSGQKLKLLYLIKMLQENTDENHPMSTPDIIKYLENQGIHAERKSIYSDMESLADFGYDVVQVQSRLGGGYYLGSREFELPELKLLVDAVQSSRFITTKKSRDLIRKLEQIAGKNDAGKLQRQVYVAGRIKTENESIYYNIDAIHRAIQENRQITFVYLDWNLQKELVPRPGGDKCVSPWALIWRDENYYLAAYDSEAKVIKHYRVDKMGQVEVTVSPREGVKQFSQIDVTSYTNQTFGMFAGEESGGDHGVPEAPHRCGTGPVRQRGGYPPYVRYRFPGACEGGRQRTVLRMACGNRTGCQDRSAGSSTEALCTVAFGYFAGTVGNCRLKIYPKFHPLFCIVF